MLKLWGRETSGRTQKVLWTLAETGIEFELIRASGEMGPGGHVSKGNPQWRRTKANRSPAGKRCWENSNPAKNNPVRAACDCAARPQHDKRIP